MPKQELLNPKDIGTAKRTKHLTPVEHRGMPIHGIYGIGLMFVCISISYMAFLVINGTDGYVNKVIAAPALLFVVAFLITKSWK